MQHKANYIYVNNKTKESRPKQFIFCKGVPYMFSCLECDSLTILSQNKKYNNTCFARSF